MNESVSDGKSIALSSDTEMICNWFVVFFSKYELLLSFSSRNRNFLPATSRSLPAKFGCSQIVWVQPKTSLETEF